MENISNKKIGIFGFFALTGSMILTVYSYPVLASCGLKLVFFLLAAAFFYFIPTALISAELATGQGWEVGGIYKWASIAFSKRWGFFAIFLQWAQITVGFLAMLYFIVGSISYLLHIPSLNNNPFYKCIAVIIIFWILTFINFKGSKFSSRIASIGIIAGVVIPIFTLIVLIILYIINGHHIFIKFSTKSFFPNFTNIHSLTIFVTFILAYAGIEASASHVNNMINPKKNYPIAITILCFFAITVAILGSISIAIVVPGNQINMSSGVIQTFNKLLNVYHIGWLTNIFALLLAIGALAEVSSWIVGPSEGMFVAAKDNLLPKILSHTNKNNVPVNLIILQAIVVTIWSIVITLGGDGNNLSFIIAMALAVLIYLAMYVLLFITYFVLKYRYPNNTRAFIVPGGEFGRIIIPCIGLLTSMFAIIISFFPPNQIKPSESHEYEIILLVSFLCVILLPHCIYTFRKKYGYINSVISNLDNHNKWVHLRGRKQFYYKNKNIILIRSKKFKSLN